jgi:LDH2 family malate/lactate/ureidoglycolate dehydrogenase
MEDHIAYLPVAAALEFIQQVFIHSGVPAGDARICADILIASDARGIESHGLSRLKMYYDRIRKGIQHPVTEITVVKDTFTTAVFDGNHGMGQVIGYRAMQTAIEKAKVYGIGMVATRNSTHYGIAGYYPMMAIRAGMIGVSVTNTRPSIAPTFGVQPMLGTNPIAFGAPTDEEFPFLFDAATSIIQRGKVEVAARKDIRIPDGWVIDNQGNFANDPASILKGLSADTNSLLPLGGAGEEFSGYKGYGLATIVEVLSSSLQTGAFLHGLTGFDKDGKQQPYKIGHFFMAMNIENFLPLDEFKHNIGELLRELRSSQKAPGAERIYTAGEKEYEHEQKIKTQGIPVVPDLQKELKFLQTELQLDPTLLPY